MKPLLHYINESIEDGKYIDLPTTDLYRKEFRGWKPSKPSKEEKHRGPGQRKMTVWKKSDEQYAKEMAKYEEALAKYKEAKDAHDKAWQEHVNLTKKVNAENFTILIDKVYKALSEQTRRDDFVKATASAIIEEMKKITDTWSRRKSWTEERLENAVIEFRKALSIDENLKVAKNLKTAAANIYHVLSVVANFYSVDIPKFSSLDADLFTKSADDLYDEWRDTQYRDVSDKKYKAMQEKFDKEFARNSKSVMKFRTKWMKTDEYKVLTEICDKFEDDVEKAFKAADKAYMKFDELNGKNKAYEEMKEKMLPLANKWLKTAFEDTLHATSCYGRSLIDVLVMVGLAGTEDPKVEIINKSTSSWLSGMRHSCEFKVTDKDGNSYETGKYEDRGFDSFERSAGDGFGPWD